ncbi:MAG: NnrS family protein, partial [Caulobacterales bacterium]
MTAATLRGYQGPPLFSYGFRPFFLFAALWAALAIPLWALVYLGGGVQDAAIDRDWHVHEMLFGYLAAVIAGFLLTSVPNWTGRLPVTGAPLAILVCLWVAGRVAMLAEPWLGAAPVSLFDLAFLPALAVVLWREVIAGRSWRNLAVCALVTLLAAANLGLHLRPLFPQAADVAERVALATPAMLLALIGGRITPSFTHNWLLQHGSQVLPAPAGQFDRIALAATGAGLLAWILAPTNPLSGVLLLAAGLSLLVRLVRWRGERAAAEPLVWVLHAGYGWLALALALLGAAALAPGLVPRSAGL